MIAITVKLLHLLSKPYQDNGELKNHDEVHDDDVCLLGKDWNENVIFGGEKETFKRCSRLVGRRRRH